MPAPTMREQIALAFDGNEADPNPPAEGATGSETPPAEGGGSEAPPSETPPAEGATQQRDALGRFVGEKPAVTAAPAAPTPPAQGGKPAVAAAPVAPVASQHERAPASWTPAAREAWNGVPEHARAEIHRREVEVQRVLHESASARQLSQELEQIVGPHLGRIQMNGVTPFQAIGNLFQVEQTLAQGSPHQQATMIAQLVRTYGIDIQMLDNALANGQGPGGQPAGGNSDFRQQQAMQHWLQQQMAPYQQFMQNVQQRQQQYNQRVEAEAAQEIAAAEQNPEMEFFNDVRETMADIVEVATRRGIKLSMLEAYQQAIQIDPHVRSVLQSRQTQQTQQQSTVAAQRAKKAAVSISGAPVMGTLNTEAPKDLRGAVAAAIDASTGRV